MIPGEIARSFFAGYLPTHLIVSDLSMELVDLSSWEDFEERLKALTSTPPQLEDGAPLGYVSPFLFRGQANHCWRLTTTLERYIQERMSVKRYYRTIHAAKPQIETFTGADWSILTPPEYEEWLAKQDMLVSGKFPGYEYMVYLRHHGFPSPLLDWTRSPYVAAYFAFVGASEAGERVAIFAFREHAGAGKGWIKKQPHIETLGPYVRSHKRHFLQQSEYSICLVYDADTWFFANHEAVCGDAQSGQDILWKFTLPVSEKLKVLRMLDGFNLNSFSLFASEEALMETMALRELYFRANR